MSTGSPDSVTPVISGVKAMFFFGLQNLQSLAFRVGHVNRPIDKHYVDLAIGTLNRLQRITMFDKASIDIGQMSR
jgi:hypothetical protein